MAKKGILSLFLIFVLIIIIAFFFIFDNASFKNTGFSSTHTTISLFLTDPFSVPAGTNAIIFNYSSIIISITKNNNESNISSTSEGYAVLQTDSNNKILLGYISVPINSTLNELKLKINNAEIEINSTFYNLTLINKTLDAVIVNKTAIKNNQSVLVYVSGSILPVFSDNSIMFFAEPSAIAVTGNLYGNQSIDINGTAMHPKISVINDSINITNNITNIALKLKDTSSVPVLLNTISLSGNMALLGSNNNAITANEINASSLVRLKNIINFSFINNSKINDINISGINSALSGILSYLTPISSTITSTAGKALSGISGYITSNASSSILSEIKNINYSAISSKLPKNISRNISGGLIGIKNNLTTIGNEIKEEYLTSIDSKEKQLATITFLISKNGTLYLPDSNLNNTFAKAGMYLLPNETISLSYRGEVIFAGNNIFIPIENNTYTIWIMGSNDLAQNTYIKAA